MISQRALSLFRCHRSQVMYLGCGKGVLVDPPRGRRDTQRLEHRRRGYTAPRLSHRSPGRQQLQRDWSQEQFSWRRRSRPEGHALERVTGLRLRRAICEGMRCGIEKKNSEEESKKRNDGLRMLAVLIYTVPEGARSECSCHGQRWSVPERRRELIRYGQLQNRRAETKGARERVTWRT